MASKVVVNKYGKEVLLSPTKGTKPELRIASILDELSIPYETDYRFDESGLRSSHFDVAVFSSTDGKLAFLIEYDGPTHYDEKMFLFLGNRPERNKAHIVKANLADAEKAKIAWKKGIPMLRINKLYDDCLRDLIIAWVWKFIDCSKEKTNEISMIQMLDKYGWDFEYVPQSEPPKKVKAFLESRNSQI